MIGQLFGKAWELYKRDVWWLILAGFIAVVIFAVAAAVVIAILLAILKGSGVDATDLTTDGSSLGAAFGAAVAAYVVGVTLASIVALVFSGGFYEMVIGAEREGRAARIGDLFSGFRRFGSYALLWLCQIGAVLGIELIVILAIRFTGPLGLLVGLAGFCVIVWLMVSWIYGVVLITDRDMGGVEALQESLRMVKTVGWWSTFLALLVLGLAYAAVMIVISIVGSQSAGVSATLTAIFYIFAFPFGICYVAAMYLGSSWSPAVSGGRPFGVPEPPAAPAGGGGMYQPAAAPAAPAGADAWRAAADPLAAPPLQSLHAPARPGSPPRAPEPPAPPAPDPATGSPA